MASDELRFVQLTPPGSACSIAFGKGVVDTPPGALNGLQMVVRGVEVSDVRELPPRPS